MLPSQAAGRASLLPRMLVQSFLAQWVLFVVPALYLVSNCGAAFAA